MTPRCRLCGELLFAPMSVQLGYGPKCAAKLGLSAADLLPQRCDCCVRSNAALRLLYGVRSTIPVQRYDGSPGWVDPDSGELLTADGPAASGAGGAAA